MITPDKRAQKVLERLDKLEERIKAAMHKIVKEAAEELYSQTEGKLPPEAKEKLKSYEVKKVSGLNGSDVGYAVVGEPKEEFRDVPEDSRFKGPARDVLSSEFGLNGKPKKGLFTVEVSKAARKAARDLPDLNDDSLDWGRFGDPPEGGEVSKGDLENTIENFQKALGIKIE